MKITRRDLGVIMILVGIIAVFLTYKVSFSATQDEISKLQDEQKSIRNQISELEPVKNDAPKYEKRMAEFESELDSLVKEFPVNILMEDNIMYVVELENESKFNIAIPSFSGSEASEVNAVDGAGALAGKRYSLSQATLNFGYTVDEYKEMKEFLNYIYSSDDNKRVITSVSMSFDDTDGSISGSIALVSYAMSDGVREYNEQKLPLDKLGVDSIFGEVVEEDSKN